MNVGPGSRLQKRAKTEFRILADAPELREDLHELRERLLDRRRAYGLMRRSPPEEYAVRKETHDAMWGRASRFGEKLRRFVSQRVTQEKLRDGILAEIPLVLAAVPLVESGELSYGVLMTEVMAWRTLIREVFIASEESKRQLELVLFKDPGWKPMDKIRDKLRGQKRLKRGYWKAPKVKASKARREAERRAAKTPEAKAADKAAKRERMARLRMKRAADSAMYDALLEEPKKS